MEELILICTGLVFGLLFLILGFYILYQIIRAGVRNGIQDYFEQKKLEEDTALPETAPAESSNDK